MLPQIPDGGMACVLEMVTYAYFGAYATTGHICCFKPPIFLIWKGWRDRPWHRAGKLILPRGDGVRIVLAGTLVGHLSAKCEQVLAYYFGSSRSSDRKTELLAQAPAIR